MTAVSRDQRYTRERPCPICQGYDAQDRGQGKRCGGYLSPDGLYARCQREELAGATEADEYGLYRHRLRDDCHCGARHGSDSPRVKNEPEAVYAYRDASGRLLCEVTRWPGKRFSQRRPVGSGWAKDTQGVPWTLYRLPELIAADPGAPVYVVEGEKDVDTMRRLGHVATCNRGGANKAARTDWTPLRGRRVIVIADADEPGRKHAAEVARITGGTAYECTGGKDVTDHIQAGGSLEQLVPMASAPTTGTRKRPAPEADARPAKKASKGDGGKRPPMKIEGWERALLFKKNGVDLRPITANAATILAHDPRWQGVLAYDEFAETIVTTSAPPWRPCDVPEGGAKPGDWTDEDTTRVQCWLSDAYTLDLGTDAVLFAIRTAAHRKVVHPVRSWLDSLRWDGKQRLPTWLPDVMGCDDNIYTRAVGTAWAVSAVARAYEPGCKVDTVLVLEGPPGTFKSSVLRALAGDPWFLEMSITDVSNKDAMQILKRKWIAEFPEIDGLSKNEQSHVKAYFSRQVDTYRASYGRGSKDHGRQMVFAATTNKSEWIVDETGGTGRRMWPVRVRHGDTGLAMVIRDQFWAEARARYEGGEKWHITDPKIIEFERAEQDLRFRSDPWESTIAIWLARPSDVGSLASFGVTTSEVMGTALAIESGRQTVADAMRVGAILRRIGWHPGNPETRNGARVRVYRPRAEDPSASLMNGPTPRIPVYGLNGDQLPEQRGLDHKL